jgi:prepilin-type N-terminal cleavage/methylation domain-containing protein
MRTFRDDKGFTLSELIVVMGLIGVVITVVYGSMFAMVQASRASDRQARFTNEVASPLLVIDTVLVQNSSIEEASPYRIVVLTDRDLNNKMERTLIEATADGELRYRVEELNAQRTARRARDPGLDDLGEQRERCRWRAALPLFHRGSDLVKR